MTGLKVLHLFSDFRLTGPAVPVIQLCRALADRGHDVTLAYRRGPDPDHPDAQRLPRAVADAGVKSTTHLALNRYLPPVPTVRDLVQLRRYLRDQRFDVVHCHLSHDHMLAAACTLGMRPRVRRPRLVRCMHLRDVLTPNWHRRLLLHRLADGLVVFTPAFRQAYIQQYHLDEDTIVAAPPMLELSRYQPDAKYRDMRREFAIADDAVVIGIVARYQAYRRMDIFFDAAARVAAAEPAVRFLIIGTSGQYEETVVKPIAALGLQEQVVLASYRRDDYLDTLACLDVATLLIPGSDGTARAVRQAMAMAKPCVVSDYGMLPELVRHEQAGLVTALDPAALADAWLRLVRDPVLRRRLGAQARALAVENFDPARSAAVVESLYHRLGSRVH